MAAVRWSQSHTRDTDRHPPLHSPLLGGKPPVRHVVCLAGYCLMRYRQVRCNIVAREAALGGPPGHSS